MAYEFKTVRRVEFSETDMAGLMHFSNYFRYMETVELNFLRSLGYSVVMRHLNPPLGWPRVQAECTYRRPLHFEDQVEIHLLVREVKSKSLSYVFKFRKLNADPPIEVARGAVTVVCVATEPDGSMAATDMPVELLDQLEVAPAELLA